MAKMTEEQMAARLAELEAENEKLKASKGQTVKAVKNQSNMATILIVDDEKSIRRTLKEILEYEKYKVDGAFTDHPDQVVAILGR